MLFHKTNISAITPLLAEVAKLTEDVLAELRGLPPPSAFAYCNTWRVWQEKDKAILNLRPPTNQGLPIEVLHPAFASFHHDVRSMPPDMWTLESDVNQVSLSLCKTMAYDFENDNTRRTQFKNQLRKLGLELVTHICRSRALIRHLFTIWRAKGGDQMEFRASSWWFVVSRACLNKSFETTKCLIFRPTSHSRSWLL